MIGVVQYSLAKAALDRSESLLGVDHESTAGANPLPVVEHRQAEDDRAEHRQRQRRLSLSGSRADHCPAAAHDDGPEQLVIPRRVRQRAEIAGGDDDDLSRGFMKMIVILINYMISIAIPYDIARRVLRERLCDREHFPLFQRQF